MGNRKVKMLVLCTLVVVIICGCMAALLIGSKGKGEVYAEKLSYAQECLDGENYQEAVYAFLSAIEADDTQPLPYITLAQLYYSFGQTDDAVALLDKGYGITSDDEIKALLDQYRNSSDATIIEQSSDENKKEDGNSGIVINTTLLNQYASNNYGDYTREHATTSSVATSNGVNVSFDGVSGTMSFFNDAVHSHNVDNATGMPTLNATPNYIVLKDISMLFSGMGEGVSYAELEAIGLTGLTKSKNSDANKNIVSFESTGCKINVECDSDGNITSKDAWNQIIPPEKNETEDVYPIYFILKNASNDEIIPNAVVTFYPVDDSSTITATGTSDSLGNCLVNVAPGAYVVKVEAEDYASYENTISVSGYEDDTPNLISMSSSMAEGQMRIVLNWGEAPRDLDSYLFCETTSRKVYFGNKYEEEANLDRDDMDGEGPETITINDLTKSYKYAISDYNMTDSLGESGAVVTVYRGDTMVGTYPVNSSARNNWFVFTIINGEISMLDSCDTGTYSGYGSGKME